MPSDILPRLAEGENSAAGSWLRFAQLCETLAGTRSKLVKRAAMADYLRALDAQAAGLAAQFLTGAVFPESDERKAQVGSQLIARAVGTATQASEEAFHAAYRRYGDLGAAAEELLQGANQTSQGVALEEIAARFDSLAAARTQTAKIAHFSGLLRLLSPIETKYLIKLLLGDMRTGVKQGLVEESIAVAANENLPAVRRAETMLGNIPEVVELAWRHALDTARFRMFHPLGFMLATPAASADEALARFENNPAQVEDKYDGMRAQIHCGDAAQPGRVRIFSRTREDVTASFPELAEWFAVASRPAILDGEILAWDFSLDRALPFTALQQRLGRKRVTAEMRSANPVLYLAFDILLDGENLLLDVPLRDRRGALERWAEEAQAAARAQTTELTAGQRSMLASHTVAEQPETPSRLKLAPIAPVTSVVQIEDAFLAAQRRGNEGLMLKSLASIYEPGRRGATWLKLKRELATLDVVVTAAEYGNGRRAAVLSDYTFAVRDGTRLRNVGKAYSGLTDVEIEGLTKWFLEHTLDTQNGRLIVEPKIVLEVAFNNVMRGERHDSGYSLRFPRIARIRTDKPVEEIDTLDRVAEIFRTQHASGDELDVDSSLRSE